MNFTRPLITWILFLPFPILNGFLREKWYKPALGEIPAQWIGVSALGLIFLGYVYLSFAPSISGYSSARLFALGALWLGLTLAFEFGLGLATGKSWSYMLADYNILQGRAWPFLLLVIFFSPFIVKALAR